MNKEMLKGTTDIILLNLLKKEPMYGYGIIQALSIMSKGLFEFKEGTLYPILHSLEKKGYIQSYWEQRTGERKRKYYKITKNGIAHLAVREKEWTLFSSTLSGLLQTDTTL